MSQNSQELPILEFSFSLSASSHNFDAHLRCDFWNKTYTYVWYSLDTSFYYYFIFLSKLFSENSMTTWWRVCFFTKISTFSSKIHMFSKSWLSKMSWNQKKKWRHHLQKPSCTIHYYIFHLCYVHDKEKLDGKGVPKQPSSVRKTALNDNL